MDKHITENTTIRTLYKNHIISRRLANALATMEQPTNMETTLKTVLQASKSDLIKMRCFGVKCQKELSSFIRDYNQSQDKEILSDCCNAQIVHSDICSDCQEHCL